MSNKCPKCNHENPDDTLFCGKCGTQLPAPEKIEVTETMEAPKEELTTGSTFAGRYQIIEELGKGGMGKVYKVHDTKIKEKIALKLIKPEIAKDKKTIERFSNELRLARKIRHKNICQMFDLGEDRGTHFITMEFVPGQDLKGLIRQSGQLAVGTTINIAKQICDGLTEAHKSGVVHRDLKPSNIMIDTDGDVRIMDFGIARSLEAKGITGAGVMIGTPEYMSPEQVDGKDTDQRSDIYSLGVILFEMVTGRVPFEGDTPFTVGVKQKSETPQNPKEINSQIPDDLNNMILKCLEKEKEQRYQSAGELHSELENIEKGIPTTQKVIPERKPLTSREITVTFGLKKLFIPALVIVVIVIAVVLIWQPWSQKEVVSVPTDKPSLAIMYFKNNTGDADLEHWRMMLSNLLIADLTQSKHIRVLSEDKLYNILSHLNQLEAKTYSSEVLEQVAAQGRVNHIVQGAYAKAGDEFRINVVLQEVKTGELVGSESVAGKGEESIFSMVDDLTRRIKESFKLTEQEIASDIDMEVGKITTSSPEAYKYYLEGRKYHGKGELRQSITSMQKAIAIDPEFAMAYRSMNASYTNMGYSSKARECFQKAYELIDRLSDSERYMLTISYNIISYETIDKAFDAAIKLTQSYPEENLGNTRLGQIYNHTERWDKAIERFNIEIQRKNEAPYPYYHIAFAYMAKGLYDKATEILEYYINNLSDNVYIREQLVLCYLCQGKYDFALEEADEGLSLNPAFTSISRKKGNIYLCQGDLSEAEKEYKKLLEGEDQGAQLNGRRGLRDLYIHQGKQEKSKEQLMQGIDQAEKIGEKSLEQELRLGLAYIHLKSSNSEEALKEYKKAWDIAVEQRNSDSQSFILMMKGLTYVEMNSLNEARKAADTLKELIEKGINTNRMRLYYNQVGSIELKKKNYSEAIENFEKALSLMPYQRRSVTNHALFIDPLAIAYFMSGDLDKAQLEYEKITALTVGRLNYGDIYAKSIYMLGKIYEQKGWNGKAIERYEKFLDLWKDADPGIAEVEDARKRLTGLKF